MGRAMLGVLAGLCTMFVVIMGIQYLGYQLYPPMPLEDLSVIDVAFTFTETTAARAIVVVGWVAGAFAGGWVAAKISRRFPYAAAVVVALGVIASVAAMGVLGMLMHRSSHTDWMVALGLLLPLPAALLAARLARPRATVAEL